MTHVEQGSYVINKGRLYQVDILKKNVKAKPGFPQFVDSKCVRSVILVKIQYCHSLERVQNFICANKGILALTSGHSLHCAAVYESR